jgi:hypothetical protein
LKGKSYCARSINVNEASFDILVNMDTPYNKNSPPPLMPNEALSSINGIAQVDSLNIVNGRLSYAERYMIGTSPAEVTFDSIQLSAEGITNQGAPGAAAVIHAEGTFMKTSKMKLHMVIPVRSPEGSFKYSGSLDAMDLTRLNAFLEIGERVRIKSGTLQSATFDVDVSAGHASGTLRPIYRDLTIAVLYRRTGSEKGAYNRVISFITNAMKIRKTNMLSQSGSMKVGKVKYTRKRDDTYLQLAWFSLRSGVGDVVGF